MTSVAIIDYGMGNLHSISKALQHVTQHDQIVVTSDAHAILQADRVVVPGVGAIRDCMAAIQNLGLNNVIHEVAQSKPLLGICIGLQAMLDESEENNHTPCLGIFSGKVVRFKAGLTDDAGHQLKIPHMGWNQVHQTSQHPLWQGIEQDTRFYFVHSYYTEAEIHADVQATSNYPTPFACALGHKNIFAVQFHPEKSHNAGLKLLQNFLTWNGHDS